MDALLQNIILHVVVFEASGKIQFGKSAEFAFDSYLCK